MPNSIPTRYRFCTAGLVSCLSLALATTVPARAQDSPILQIDSGGHRAER